MPSSDSDAPPSAGQYDQEFLYHLYRGSELLQDNAVADAKAELERALKLQPRDVEGQGLLGIVYFRLGLYPRAIEIYEQLQVVAPLEVTPRINLALCYLKTAQAELARAQLEEVLRLAPDHQRAWGYLGLVFQRFGDFDKARIAFERAGRPKMAERMAELAAPAHAEHVPEIAELAAEPTPNSVSPASFRPSLMPRVPRTELAAPPLGSLLPPAPPPLQVPAALHNWVREAECVFPESPRAVLSSSGKVLLRIAGALHVRPDWLTVLSPDRGAFATHAAPWANARSPRSVAGNALVALRGSGRALLSPQHQSRLALFELHAEHPSVWVESRVVALEPELSVAAAPLAPEQAESPQILRVSGAGNVVLWSREPLQSLNIAPERPLLLRTSWLLGWVGKLQVRALSPLEAPAGLTGVVQITGRGHALVDPLMLDENGAPPIASASR